MPPCPEEMEYLVEMIYEVSGRSGEGMSGYVRMSHQELLAYAELEGIDLEPYEVDALRKFDDALLNPDAEPPKEGEADATPEPHRPQIPQIRQRPAGVEPQFVTPIDC